MGANNDLKPATQGHRIQYSVLMASTPDLYKPSRSMSKLVKRTTQDLKSSRCSAYQYLIKQKVAWFIMLDSFFEYQKITYQSLVNEKYRKGITHYRFHSEKYPYLVHVEHYVNNIYVVKYCMAKHKNNSKRYNLLIRDYKCSRIVSTCVRIMLSVD